MIDIGLMISDIDNIKKMHKEAMKDSAFYQIPAKLEKLRKNTTKNDFREVYKFLLEYMDQILIGNSEDLLLVIRKYKRLTKSLYNSQSIPKYLNKRILKVFDYDRFKNRQSQSHLWSAYELAKKLSIPVCPYCNRIFTTTIDKSTARTRPAFDHFYPQHSFPFLALSLFNLVPCCSICNSSLKNTRDVTLNTFINPYFGGFEQIREFTIELRKKPTPNQVKEYVAEFYSGSSSRFKISFKDVAIAPRKDIRKANRNIALFQLRVLYNTHKDYILELLQKSVTYNKSRRDEIWKLYKKIFIDKNDINKMIFGNYLNSGDLGKRPLAKLTKDIAKELGLPV